MLPDADNYYADLMNLFQIIHNGAPELQVPHYNGGLFSDERHPFLDAVHVGVLPLSELLNTKPWPLGRRSTLNSPQQYQRSRYFRQGGRDEPMVAGGGFVRGGRAG